jgi:hypothetical protein
MDVSAVGPLPGRAEGSRTSLAARFHVVERPIETASRLSIVWPSRGYSATPTLSDMAGDSVSTASSSEMRRATLRAAASRVSGRIRANSSPPNRGRGVDGPARHAQGVGDAAQRPITREVAVAVVDSLQVVQVEEQHREWALRALRPRHLARQDGDQPAVVAQTRQRIAHRQAPQPPLRPPCADDRRQRQARHRGHGHEGLPQQQGLVLCSSRRARIPAASPRCRGMRTARRRGRAGRRCGRRRTSRPGRRPPRLPGCSRLRCRPTSPPSRRRAFGRPP